jgi:hypothetical protein
MRHQQEPVVIYIAGVISVDTEAIPLNSMASVV